MNFTTRMAQLLGQMRRERNGAVADTMGYVGRCYGLNYGVSLPTVRQIARSETPDHDFARYLYLQDVRELRLAALHIAQPERLVAEEFDHWAAGIVNSEVASEAAFALLGRADALTELFPEWIASDNALLQYAALLAGARSAHLSAAWITPAMDAVRGADPATAHLVAQGVVSLFAVLGAQNEENRQAVLRAAGSPGEFPAADYIHEELAWRLE